MLLTTHHKPFTRAGWVFEEKLDGYRCTVSICDDWHMLWSRHDNPLPQRFYELDSLPDRTVLDGELVSMEGGKVSLQSLQRNHGPFQLHLFDCLMWAGQDLTRMPLPLRRYYLLHHCTNLSDRVFVVPQFEDGVALFNQIKRDGGEGIVAKRQASHYRPGKRSADWQKIKVPGYVSC